MGLVGTTKCKSVSIFCVLQSLVYPVISRYRILTGTLFLFKNKKQKDVMLKIPRKFFVVKPVKSLPT